MKRVCIIWCTKLSITRSTKLWPGYCTEVNVTIHIDDSVTVVDNGRGIPVDMHEEGVSAAEVVMTKLHAGGKFDSNSYKVSGGLHGVGVSCVNALSETLHLEIWRPSKESGQLAHMGTGLRTRDSQRPLDRDRQSGPQAGTKITFKPDATIMVATKFNFDTLAQRLRELAFLNKGLKITLADEREDPYKTADFLYNGGIAEFIKHLNRGKSVLHDTPIYMEGEKPGGRAAPLTSKSRCSITTATRKRSSALPTTSTPSTAARI